MTADPLGVAVAALREIHWTSPSGGEIESIARRAIDAVNALISAPPAAVGDSAERAVNAAESKRLLAVAPTVMMKRWEVHGFAIINTSTRKCLAEVKQPDDRHVIAEAPAMLRHIANLEAEIRGRKLEAPTPPPERAT